MKYIHYGHSEFDDKLFVDISNREFFVKPNGGLWACGIDYEYGWKEWCTDEDFSTNGLDTSFKFEIDKNSKIYTIRSVKQLESLPKLRFEYNLSSQFVYLDFEALKNQYDAIEVLISKDMQLYWSLYGWDCDSILIMNKDIIRA